MYAKTQSLNSSPKVTINSPTVQEILNSPTDIAPNNRMLLTMSRVSVFGNSICIVVNLGLSLIHAALIPAVDFMQLSTWFLGEQLCINRVFIWAATSSVTSDSEWFWFWYERIDTVTSWGDNNHFQHTVDDANGEILTALSPACRVPTLLKYWNSTPFPDSFLD